MLYRPPQRAVGVNRKAGIPPPAWPSLDMLREYQAHGSRWLRLRARALLADDMSLGKSAQVLRALPYRARVIIVCPKSVALVWQDEVTKWRSDLYATVGEPLRRPHENEVLIISYGSLPSPPTATSLKLILEPLGDVYLVFDEAHALMTGTAQRTAKARRLRRQCGFSWGLTGTPMPGDPRNLWGLLLTLGLEDIFLDLEEFIALCGGRKKYVRVKGQLRDVGYVWGAISPEVKRRLQEGPMLRRTRLEVLKDLPPVETMDIPVESPESLTAFLDEVKDAWDSVGPDDLPPFELLSEAMSALARSKIETACEFVDNAASLELPILVFSAHVDPILAAGKLKGAVSFIGPTSQADRKKAIDKFKSGKARILATTIACGGVGLNLQEAGGVFFVDRDYTPGLNLQALARAQRPGTKHARVLCWRTLSRHPLEQRLSAILDEKQRVISAAIG